jgi:hypothetical protein
MVLEAQCDNEVQFMRRSRAVSATTGISFVDYSRMHVFARHVKNVHWRKGTPEWTVNDQQMRNVILTFLERRYYITSLVPTGATDADRLARIETHAKFQAKARQKHLDDRLDAHRKALDEGAPAKRLRELELEAQNADSRAMFDRRPVELLNAVVYLSYRLGYNSTTVAEQLKMRAPAVRVLLYRLNYVADDIKSGCVRHRKSRKGQPQRRFTKQELVRLWFLRHSGLSWAQVAKKLGRDVSGGHGKRSGSNLIPVYQRWFENHVERKGRWTHDAKIKLWLMHHTAGQSWDSIGARFGLTAAGAMAAYRRYFE